MDKLGEASFGQGRGVEYLLALFLSASASPPPARAEGRARATITIIRPYRASPKSWDPAAQRHQKDIVVREKDGTAVRVRLTEFE